MEGWEMKTSFLPLMFWFCIFLNSAIANDDLKIRQTIGKDVMLFWYHNEQQWGSELLYGAGNKPWLLLGAGPNYTGKMGPAKIRVFGYAAGIANVAKNHWPIETIEIESFVVPTVGKWTIHIRSLADVAIAKSELTFSGRDFLGYQVSSNWQPRLQTEWKYNKGLDQSLGLGWLYKLSSMLSTDGYIGCYTKKPNGKTGWLRFNFVFQ